MAHRRKPVSGPDLVLQQHRQSLSCTFDVVTTTESSLVESCTVIVPDVANSAVAEKTLTGN